MITDEQRQYEREVEMPTEAQWDSIIHGGGTLIGAVIVLMYLKFFLGGGGRDGNG